MPRSISYLAEVAAVVLSALKLAGLWVDGDALAV